MSERVQHVSFDKIFLATLFRCGTRQRETSNDLELNTQRHAQTMIQRNTGKQEQEAPARTRGNTDERHVESVQHSQQGEGINKTVMK